MDLDTFVAKRDALKAEQKRLLRESGGELLQAVFKPLLESGLIREVAWAQYTPFFNDGEACYFSVNDPYFLTERAAQAGEDDYFHDVDSWTLRQAVFDCRDGELENPDYSPELIKLVQEFSAKFWKVEDIMEDVFGDHVKVIAKLRDGETIFNVEEYEDHE